MCVPGSEPARTAVAPRVIYPHPPAPTACVRLCPPESARLLLLIMGAFARVAPSCSPLGAAKTVGLGSVVALAPIIQPPRRRLLGPCGEAHATASDRSRFLYENYFSYKKLILSPRGSCSKMPAFRRARGPGKMAGPPPTVSGGDPAIFPDPRKTPTPLPQPPPPSRFRARRRGLFAFLPPAFFSLFPPFFSLFRLKKP